MKMNSTTRESTSLKSIMRYAILLCVILCVNTSCMSALRGAECEQIQEAGQKLADNIKDFDTLLQDVFISCFKESQLIIESSLTFLMSNAGGLNIRSSVPITAIESKVKLQQISLQMDARIDAGFGIGYAKFFSLLKKAGNLVVGNSVVTDALIKYQTSNRKKRSVINNIDDKVGSLRQEMNTSLSGVEQNLHGVAKQIFDMLSDSVQQLVDTQKDKTTIDNWRKSMGLYLMQAMHGVIGSQIEKFYLVLKDSAKQIELLDSLVGNAINDPAALARAVKPAKMLIDEEIQNLKKSIGPTEVKRQLQLKLTWVQQSFGAIKMKLKTY